jgi:hypothetical protein
MTSECVRVRFPVCENTTSLPCISNRKEKTVREIQRRAGLRAIPLRGKSAIGNQEIDEANEKSLSDRTNILSRTETILRAVRENLRRDASACLVRRIEP